MRFISGVTFALSIAACGTDTGSVQVFVQAEDTIIEGVQPGTEGDSIQDGWTITYSRFLFTIGNFRAYRSSAPNDKHIEPKTYVLDVKALPASGFIIAELDGLAAERWDKVGFDAANASSAAVRPDFTSQADYDLMVQNKYSIYVEGKATKPDGQSCLPTAPATCVAETEVTFQFGLSAGTSFDDCADESGDSGFAVPSGGTVQIRPTIHGDHWFFTNITQGAEITERRAQWLANADLDHDKLLTLDEAGMSAAGDLFPNPPYNLSGAIIQVNNGADYITAQSHTLGDYNGDGECPTRAVIPLQ